MSTHTLPTPRVREFLPQEFKITVWSKLKPYFNDLIKRPIQSVRQLERWILDESELETLFEEELQRRYWAMQNSPDDARATDSYEYIVHGIGSHIKSIKQQIYLRLLQSPCLQELEPQKYKTYLRSVKAKCATYTELNSPLQESITQLLTDDNLLEKLDQLVCLRHQLAVNAGFDHYRDFRFMQLERFDYTAEHCHELHDIIADVISPLVQSFDKKEFEFLQKHISVLQLNVEPANFQNKITQCLNNIHPVLGASMGKTPPHIPCQNNCLPEFLDHLQTTGAFIQQVLSGDQQLQHWRRPTPELKALASKTIELLIMDNPGDLFGSSSSAIAAKKYLLQHILLMLPHAAMTDRFEHWLYKHHQATTPEREHAARYMYSRFNDLSTSDETSTFELSLDTLTNPFKHIEFIITQLGAIAIWRQYRLQPAEAINGFIKALQAGNSLPLDDIFNLADIRLLGSRAYIESLMAFVQTEIEKLD